MYRLMLAAFGILLVSASGCGFGRAPAKPKLSPQDSAQQALDEYDANGDGSPISDIIVTDSIASPVTYVSGDDGDGLLERGEAWIYTASYLVQHTDPDPLVGVATVTGRDGDGDLVSDVDSVGNPMGFDHGFHFRACRRINGLEFIHFIQQMIQTESSSPLKR